MREWRAFHSEHHKIWAMYCQTNKRKRKKLIWQNWWPRRLGKTPKCSMHSKTCSCSEHALKNKMESVLSTDLLNLLPQDFGTGGTRNTSSELNKKFISAQTSNLPCNCTGLLESEEIQKRDTCENYTRNTFESSIPPQRQKYTMDKVTMEVSETK